MSVTIADVAKRAGVSKKTVSRVINQEDYVAETTRAKVLAAMDEMGFVANVAARRLASGRANSVGVIFHNASWKYINLVLRTVIETGLALGYTTLIHPCDACREEDNQGILQLAMRRDVDGLIFTPPSDNSCELLDALDLAKVPYIRLTPTDRQRPMPYVTTDDRHGAYSMGKYLLSLGHRRFGYLWGPREQHAAHARFEGFRCALQEEGIELEPGHVQQGDDQFATAVACTHKILATPPRPTAIFANNDEMAFGILVAAGEVGFAVPQELSIAGFDDIPQARQVWPQLTTVRQPIHEMAQLATELLIRMLEGEKIKKQHHEIPTQLIVRGSTCAIE